MVSAYDPMEEKRIDGINTTKIFPCFSSMVESFENLDTSLRDWRKEKVEKCIVKVWISEVGRRKQNTFF